MSLTMREKFWEFDRANPAIYAMFCRFANEAIAAGRKTLSAGLIAERIRWETYIKTTGDEFKLNNNFRAFYARKFMKDHPHHRGIFRTRESVADAG